MSSNAPLRRSKTAAILALLAAYGFSAGCSGPSTYHTTSNPAVAVAHVIGEKPTSAAGADPVAVSVRAQSQVTLTGNASSGGAASIGNFAWKQTDSSATPAVKLLYLDSDTVTFTAPAVGQDTTLHFTLTVTTAGGGTATAHVTVLVKAANDSQQLLAQPANALHSYKVAIATVEGLGPLAVPAETLSTDVPICVTENRTIVYVARDGAQHSVNLPAIQMDTAWATTIGGAPNGFGSYSNPRVVFQIPALNQDDLALMFNNPVPGESSDAAAARLAQQLVPADVDLASVSITATAGAGPCATATATAGVAGKTLVIQILDQNGNPVGSATTASTQGTPVTSAAFTPDLLVSQTAAPIPNQAVPTSQYETADTARAYYDAIDPAGAKTTLTDWLNANCFNAAMTNYGADAHSVYTNNFDLGFGRDMYFVSCKTGAHTGDMASVVINYASIEAAASKLNPIIAVAMEYSAATDAATTAGQSRNQRKFAKFYVFAPDDRTGEFRRVSSANFDHRGEKYVPGACAMCHGGNVPQFPANFAHAAQSTATSYATIADPTAAQAPGTAPQLGLADVDAVFMPWDLDSFLFADTDPAFVGLSVSADSFSRASQEASLKALNRLAYCTYQPEVEPSASGGPAIDRVASSRRLVAQWYGGAIAQDGSTTADQACAQTGVPTASLLPGSYSDSYTPAGWAAQSAPGATNATTQTSDFIYHNVFARNCRSCHTQDAAPKYQFSDYASFISAFQVAVPTGGGPSAPGLGLQYAFKQAKMPLARLTMDRFWVNYAGGDSAAKILATHVQEVNAETDLVNPSTHDAIPPGSPVVFLNATGPNIGTNSFTPYTSTSAVISRFGGVSVDASTSFFIDNYSWSLCLIAPGSANCAATPLVGSGSAIAGFTNSSAGEYDLQLVAKNSLGDSVPTTFKFTVNQRKPTLANDCQTSVSNSTVAAPNQFGPTATVDLSSCITGGDEPINVPNTFQIFDPVANAFVNSVSEASLSWRASTASSCNPSRICSYSISSAFNGTAQGDPGTGIVTALSYRVTDVDGDSVTGTLNLLLTDTLTAGGGNVTFFSPPAASYAIPLSSLSNTIVPASDTGVTLVVPTNFASLPSTVAPPPGGTVQFPLGGFVPSTPQSALPGQSITYTPSSPTFLTCDFGGFDIGSGSGQCVGDSFWYYLVSGTGTATSPNVAKVIVKVQAKTSYSRTTGSGGNVFQILNGNCASCHVAVTTTDNTLANYHWAATDAANTYKSFKGTDLTYNVDGKDWTAVDPQEHAVGTASATALYFNACTGSTTHPAAIPSSDTTSCPLLLQWIREGARND